MALTVHTPCGDISYTIPGFSFQLPNLNIFPLPFPPTLSIPYPDCDVVKDAIGAEAEPPEDSLP